MGEPGAEKDPFGKVGLAGEIIATAGLGALVFLSPVMMLLAAYADSVCETKERSICQPDGMTAAMILPTAGSALGLIIGGLGCWVISRRYSFAWLAIGYLIAVIGYCGSYSIISADHR